MRRLAVALIMLLALGTTAHGKQAGVQVLSTAFTANGPIPAPYTCDGGESTPPLAFSGVPAGTKTLALIVEDPDAPAGTWTHWVVWNIPPDAVFTEGKLPAGAVQGRNSWKKNTYGGPCPPSGTHHYFFRVFALDKQLNLPSVTTAKHLHKAMEGHTLGKGELVGTYSKK